MGKLALKGGQKLYNDISKDFNHPQISDEYISSLNDKKTRSQISSFDGEGLINSVQDQFKSKFGVKYALAMNSGTSALFSMFYAHGLGLNDEVIVPAYTFFATATPLFILGCTPILADALDNGNIDPKDIRKKITSKTKAIVITHMWGIPCDMDEIMQIGEEYNLPILEDTSHAHGALYNGRVAGTFGSASAWSLGAKKLITGGQGGMMGTNNLNVYQKAILVGQANNKIIKEITNSYLLPYSITGTGLNLRMHPFSAALIQEQIIDFDKQLLQRREVAKYLTNEILKMSGLSLPRIPNDSDPSWYAFPILYDPNNFKGISKQLFVKALNAEGAIDFDIPNSTCPLTEFASFRNTKVSFDQEIQKEVFTNGQLKGAERFHHRLFKLPTWYGPRRMEYAKAHIEALKKVIDNLDELI
ncbi:MAG: aminotransferase class I/II-fold pyridoxal phosphate-dependent enzyme [Bacteroidetes bacterium]|nr:aminotransferase class I/II-fold pyridoxal phosphate-dependent enzyme [Bacteroidota bacterium]